MFALIHKHKRAAAVVIAIASLSFLFWMFSVSDFKQMFGLQRCVAVVEGSCITPREFRYELLKYSNLLNKEELRRIVKRQVLDTLVAREVLYQKAVSLGLVASDREVADLIKQDPSFQENGKFSLSKYKEILDRTGLTLEEYEEFLKKTLSVRKLLRLIEGGTYLSDLEVDFQVKLVSARLRGTAYLITPDKVKVDYEPTDDEIRNFYEKNKDRFKVRTPSGYRVWKTDSKEEAHRLYSMLKEGKIPEGGKLYEEKDLGILPKEVKNSLERLTASDRVSLSKVEGTYYLIYLEKIPSEKIKSFEEAKEEIRSLLIERKKSELVRQEAQKLKEKLVRGEKPHIKGVKFEDSTVEEFISLFRLGGDEVLRLVFSKEKVFGPYPTPNGFAVLYVEEKRFKREELKNREDLIGSLLQAKADSLMNLYAEKLFEEADIKINEEYLR